MPATVPSPLTIATAEDSSEMYPSRSQRRRRARGSVNPGHSNSPSTSGSVQSRSRKGRSSSVKARKRTGPAGSSGVMGLIMGVAEDSFRAGGSLGRWGQSSWADALAEQCEEPAGRWCVAVVGAPHHSDGPIDARRHWENRHSWWSRVADCRRRNEGYPEPLTNEREHAIVTAYLKAHVRDKPGSLGNLLGDGPQSSAFLEEDERLAAELPDGDSLQ